MKILLSLMSVCFLTNTTHSSFLVSLIFSLGIGFLSAQPCAGAAAQWQVTGSLITPRYWHSATLLNNGRVLVTGGQGTGPVLTSAELYDPARGTWKATASTVSARLLQTATLLRTGRVLLAGGF